MKRLLVILISIAAAAMIWSFTACEADGDGGSGSDDSRSYRYMFVSASKEDGDFGGKAAADAVCMADANKPAGSSTYKALIFTTDRDKNNDWVLTANTEYRRTDGTTVIATTNASATIDFDYTNTISASTLYFWTGKKSDDWLLGTSHCSNWTNNTAGVNGTSGHTITKNAMSFVGGTTACNNTTRGFLCVEQ